MGAKTLT